MAYHGQPGAKMAPVSSLTYAAKATAPMIYSAARRLASAGSMAQSRFVACLTHEKHLFMERAALTRSSMVILLTRSISAFSETFAQ